MDLQSKAKDTKHKPTTRAKENSRKNYAGDKSFRYNLKRVLVMDIFVNENRFNDFVQRNPRRDLIKGQTIK